MSTASTQHYDVIIAGARCAGAATALLLARQGARVLVLDKSRYGTDTLSTHTLMRGAVLQLHRWGLLPAVAGAGTPPVRSTTFHLADAVTTIPVKPRHGVEALYAPRRSVLDAILALAAGPMTALPALTRDMRPNGLASTCTDKDTVMTSCWPSGPPAIGTTAELSRTIGPDDIDRFTDISGDRNPLHYPSRPRGRHGSARSSSRAG
jgi:NAD(P)-dependent dehydrogenase (short-subunit alcohol dehydrogenase family)